MDPSEKVRKAVSTGTGGKGAWEELRHSQEELQGVLASIPDYLWSADIDGQGHVAYRYYSPVVESITGRPPEFYMPGPERWLSTIHPDDQPRLQAAVEVITTGQLPVLTEEYRIVRPDGAIRWVRDRVKVRRQDGGIRVDGVVSDITDRKRAEEALQLTETALREALRAAQMGVWEWMRATNTVTWDENLYLIAGRDRNLPPPSSREYSHIYTSESLERLKAAVENALARGTPYELDLEMVRPDGSRRWLIGRGEPRRDASGRITGLRGTVQDITERKRAEEALRQSEERFRTLITDAPVAIGMARSGITRYVNTAYVRMFGFQNPEETFGCPILDQHAPECHEQVKGVLRRRQQGLPVPKEYESVGRRKDGSTFPMHVAVSQVDLADGRVSLGFLTDITERKRAEEALRASEQRYRDFISHSHEGVWRVELEQPIPLNLREEEILERLLRYGYIAECNLAYAHILGFSTSQEVMGRHLHDLMPSSDAERLESFRSSIRAGLGSRTVEFRGRDLAGNLKHLLRTEIPIVENGMLVNIWGITRDVSELKRAEGSLRESEERFRATFENAGIGMALVDMQGYPFKANPALRQMLGYSDEELSRMVFTEFTHPEDRELDWELFRELVVGKRNKYEIEKRYLKKGGGVLWGQLTASLVKDAHGRPVCGVGMVQDITERKLAEAALQESDERLRSLFENATVGIYRTTPAGQILVANPALVTMLGYERLDQLVQRDLEEQGFEPDYPRELFHQWMARDGEVRGLEAVWKKQDGSPMFVRESARAIRGKDNQILYYDGFVEDITGRKRAEEELQRSRDQLRALAGRLQSVREEERTRVAREIHDHLGQALTAIKIDLSFLTRELPADKQQAFQPILKEVDETVELVRRIATELRPGILDALGLVAALEWAADEFESRHGIKCRWDLPEDDIVIDPKRATALFRILQETLTNVARHAEATEVKMRLAQEADGLVLDLEDNGKGITAQQVSAGNSLGILGMRERAFLLGGELTIRGAPGKGTSVEVRLPHVHPQPVEERK